MQNLRSQVKVYWKMNWLRRTLIAVFIVSLLLTVLPIFIQFAITYQLKSLGATASRVEDINLNLFAGTFELKKLYMVTGENEAAEIDRVSANLNMLELASSKIIIDDLTISGLKIHISRRDNGELFVNGLLIPIGGDAPAQQPATEDNSQPVAFGINRLSLENHDITYEETGFKHHSIIQSATLTDVTSWETSSTAALELDILLDNAPLKVSTRLNLFSEAPQFEGHVSLKNLSLATYEKFYKDHLKRLQASLTIEKDFNISLTDPVSLKLSGTVEIADLDVDYKNINHRSALIQWGGETEMNRNGELALSGNLDIAKSITRDSVQQYLLAEFDALNLSNIKGGLSRIELGALDLKQLRLIEYRADENQAPDDFVRISALGLKQINILTDGSNVTIANINIENPEINLALNKEKQPGHLTPLFNTLDALTQKSANQPESTESEAVAETDSTNAANIKIGQIRLLEPGKVNITDKSVSPVYKSTLHLNQIDINDLAIDEPATFSIALRQGDYTDISIKGEGLLFNPAEQLQLSAKIKQLDLPPVTPYTSNAMGYGMKSGVIDADIQVKLDKRVIDSLIDLKIDSIEMVKTNADTAEQITSASGMSIDLAVSTLKNNNNVIELKLPVKGNIDEPDFDLSLIINNAMGKAMRSATLSYLKYSLQPFGSLITLYKLTKAVADHISLPPILFKTNSVEFMDQQQELMNKISTVLIERPNLKIKACGIGALEDQVDIKETLRAMEKAALEKARLEDVKSGKVKAGEEKDKIGNITVDPKLVQQRLKELADNRAARVKAFILEQGNLDPSRILNCLSTTNTEQGSKPSVEMQI
jgi:hypothetical protein